MSDIVLVAIIAGAAAAVPPTLAAFLLHLRTRTRIEAIIETKVIPPIAEVLKTIKPPD